MTILERLFEKHDEAYAQFEAKLIPVVPADRFIGVRVPDIRALSRELRKENAYSDFLEDLPHRYYDENLLHSVLLSEIKDYEKALTAVQTFLPCIDNWCVCDTLSPKAFSRNKVKLLPEIQKWVSTDAVYTCRFGMEMLMNHFLDSDFRPEYLEIPAAVRSEEYYVNMMTAWFFATALAKQWDAALPYLEQGKLDRWTHNKTIQKAKESFRISPEQKAYLNTLKK